MKDINHLDHDSGIRNLVGIMSARNSWITDRDYDYWGERLWLLMAMELNTKIPHIKLMRNLSPEHESWFEDYQLMRKGEGISSDCLVPPALFF